MPPLRRSASAAAIATLAALAGCDTAPPAINPVITPDRALSPVAFLAGAWATSTVENGQSRTEEHWTDPIGGTMIGSSRTLTLVPEQVGPVTTSFEHLRIERQPDG